MNIAYEYQWRNAMATAIEARDEKTVAKLGSVAADWLSPRHEITAYENLVQAIFDLVEENKRLLEEIEALESGE